MACLPDVCSPGCPVPVSWEGNPAWPWFAGLDDRRRHHTLARAARRSLLTEQPPEAPPLVARTQMEIARGLGR